MAILDSALRVTAANRAYYRMFPPTLPDPQGSLFLAQPESSWRPAVFTLFADVAAGRSPAEDIGIDVDMPGGGSRHLLVTACWIADEDHPDDSFAVCLMDPSGSQQTEAQAKDASDRHALLLQETHHRIANSLQIIASILLLKARATQSEEVRAHLRDVHTRLILVATVQRQLCSSDMLEEIEFAPYCAQLCTRLADSMIDRDSRVLILSSASPGKIKASQAVSFGLIVTELVLNALKHGFPDGGSGVIDVDFTADGASWRLAVSDNGVGYTSSEAVHNTGLGTDIVLALARQLKAEVEVNTGVTGSSTALVHAAPA
jgi:chemotaxis protein methyltransferase CheR